jgi:branched-subunit amino acid ABC-type transport system permease component/ABC-type branched-subunit amino acid transport system substrate-binding protein
MIVLLAWIPLLAGCSDGSGGATGERSGPAVSDEFAGTIRLGAALSETGKYSVEGKDSRQGYDTWLTWVNTEYGGIRVGDGRYRAEIVYYDDESDADTAGNLTQRLIDDDRVDFLLGPYSSGLTTGTSAIAEANNVLMVEGNGTSDTMFERGFQNLFLVATIASDYTRSGIEALAARGARTAVIAHEDTSFATAVADGAARHLEANGIEVLAVETYPKDIQDVSAIMTKFRDLNPDLFVGGGHYNDAVLFVNSAKELDFDPDGMLITVGPSNPKLVEELGRDVDGVLGPTQWEPSMAYRGPYFGSAADYAGYYESLWGEPPVYQAASATAAALALHLAIEAAGSTGTDAVRTALRALSADTFYGPISFDERGVNTSKPMGMVQVLNGEIVVVAPGGAAVAPLEYPLGDGEAERGGSGSSGLGQLPQALVNGIALGGMYAVLVLGFSVIWGVMGVINFAHGEFVMVGAYLAWLADDLWGVDPFLSVPAVFLVMMAFGYGVQRVLVDRVIDRPHLVSLLVMFGLAIILQNAMKLIFSADFRRADTALDGSWRVTDSLTVPVTKFWILVVAVGVLGGLSFLLSRTRLGKGIRAAAQNREAARIVGIDVSKVYVIVFALCIGITGAAGALVSPVLAIQPFQGPPLTLKAFAITAMAGLGSIRGALGGAMVLGIIEAGLAVYVEGVGTNLAVVASFVILVAALVLRPQGLFGGLRPVDATAA